MDFLGRIRKLDSSLQRGLDNGFARVFGGKVVPNELEECLKQEIEDFLMQDADGQFLAPNDFRIGVSAADFNNLSGNEPNLPHLLAERMTRYCRNNGWGFSGVISVRLQALDSLHTGQLKTASRFTEDTTEHSEFVGLDTQLDDAAAADSHHAAADNAEASGHEPDAGSHSGDAASTSAAYHPGPLSPEQEQFPTPEPVPNPTDAPGTPGTPSTSGTLGTPGAPGAVAAGIGAAGAAASAAQPFQRPESGPSNEREPFNEQASDIEEFPTASRPMVAVEPEQPAPAAPTHTVTLLLQDGSNRVFEVREGSNIIGRGTASDFRLPDTGVSRQHAEITWDGQDAVLVDLHSTNGTIVNGEQIDNWLLADGDTISLGHSLLEVHIR
nr:DUF3662 and FHA domain-containing protein [Corynebacterium lactis]